MNENVWVDFFNCFNKQELEYFKEIFNLYDQKYKDEEYELANKICDLKIKEYEEEEIKNYGQVLDTKPWDRYSICDKVKTLKYFDQDRIEKIFIKLIDSIDESHAYYNEYDSIKYKISRIIEIRIDMVLRVLRVHELSLDDLEIFLLANDIDSNRGENYAISMDLYPDRYTAENIYKKYHSGVKVRSIR